MVEPEGENFWIFVLSRTLEKTILKSYSRSRSYEFRAFLHNIFSFQFRTQSFLVLLQTQPAKNQCLHRALSKQSNTYATAAFDTGNFACFALKGQTYFEKNRVFSLAPGDPLTYRKSGSWCLKSVPSDRIRRVLYGEKLSCF